MDVKAKITNGRASINVNNPGHTWWRTEMVVTVSIGNGDVTVPIDLNLTELRELTNALEKAKSELSRLGPH